MAAAGQSTPLLAGDGGTLRAFSHQDLRHVRRFSAGTSEPLGVVASGRGQLQVNAGIFQRNATGGLAPFGWPPSGGGMHGASLPGHEQSPAEVLRRSSGMTPGQEVRIAWLPELWVDRMTVGLGLPYLQTAGPCCTIGSSVSFLSSSAASSSSPSPFVHPRPESPLAQPQHHDDLQVAAILQRSDVDEVAAFAAAEQTLAAAAGDPAPLGGVPTHQSGPPPGLPPSSSVASPYSRSPYLRSPYSHSPGALAPTTSAVLANDVEQTGRQHAQGAARQGGAGASLLPRSTPVSSGGGGRLSSLGPRSCCLAALQASERRGSGLR